MFATSPTDGLAQAPPHSGWEAGGGYGPIRSPVPAGGGHLVRHFRHSRLAHCPLGSHCLPPCASQDLGLTSSYPSVHFSPCLPDLQWAPSLDAAHPPDTIPSKGCSGPGTGKGGCGRASFPHCHPPSPTHQCKPGWHCPLSAPQGQVGTRWW